MRFILQYFKDSAHELFLVSWPKQEVLIQHTTATILFVGISALVFGLVDYGFMNFFKWFLTLAS